MARLRDLISSLISSTSTSLSVTGPGTGPGASASTSGDERLDRLMRENAEAIAQLVKQMKDGEKKEQELLDRIEISQRRLDEKISRHGRDSSITMEERRRLQALNDELEEFNARQNAAINEFRDNNRLTDDEFDHMIDSFNTFGDELVQTNQRTRSAFSDTSNILNRSFNNISGDINKFFGEFGAWGALIAAATNRMIELNTKLVQHNRNMGGTFSNDMLGMDLYGNSTSGSIDTITTGNNINMDDFLKAQEIFKNRTLGLTDTFKDQAVEMRQYGIEAARLSKFYGVSMETINQISGNFLFDYGSKVKDLSKILQDGKEKATAAGVSVQNYFRKLSEASSLVGKTYIAGSIKGLEDLAAYAAKTNRSIASLTQNQNTDFAAQYMDQNKAMQLGLGQTSMNSSKAWGLGLMGRWEDRDKLTSVSLSKDLGNIGGYDAKSGEINSKGLMTLQAYGANEEQIKQIQRLNKVFRETGVTAEQQLNIEKQSIETKRKLAQYEAQNATVSERLNSLWTKIKGLILDPLQNLLAPILNTGLDVLIGVVDVLTFVLKPVTYGFGKIGELLTWIGKKISDATSYISTTLEDLGFKFEKGSGALSGFLKVLGTVVAGILSIGIGIKTVNMFKGIGSAFSGGGGLVSGGRGLVSGIGSTFRTGLSGGGSLLTRGVSAFKGLSSGAKGGLAGLAGVAVGQMVGGKAGDTISNIAGAAGTGALIGSIIPGIGTAVGAAIGGVVGLVQSSWDEIDGIWQDGSKSTWEKITASGGAIWNTLTDALSGLGDWLDDIIPDWVKDMLTGGSYSLIKDAVKDGTKEAQDDKNKYDGNMAIQNTITDPMPQITSIMNQRVVQNAYASSKTQEKLMEKQTPVNVNVQVNPSIYGNAPKQRINQF